MTISPEEIWGNWVENRGRCSGCPHRDGDLYFHPKITEREVAELMVIGEDPNDSNRRISKNGSDIEDRNDLERKRELSGNDYLEYIWGEGWNISNFFRKLVKYCNIQRKEIHLTNQKKCSDIGNNIDKKRGKEARKRCEKYLKEEIKYLAPSAVILSGRKPVNYVNREYGASLPTKTAKYAGATETIDDMVFIVSPNFGRFEPNIAQYSEYDDAEEFFESIDEYLGVR